MIGIQIVSCKTLHEDRNMNVWIKDCNLHLSYFIPDETSDCLPVGYKVKIYEGARLLVSTHTNTPDFVYSDIHSNFWYRVQVDPIFICQNSSTFFGVSSEKSVSGIPEKMEKNIKANESESLTLVCPINGAYETADVEWQHMVGLSDLVVREFKSKQLHLSNLTYKDWGKYSCTVKYKECGMTNVQKLTTYISVLIYGPPFISSLVRHFKGEKEEETPSLDSSDLSAWIDGCSLNVQVPKFIGIIDCKVVKFRLKLCRNTDIFITVDVTGRKYSYVGIDSTSLYQIVVTPTLLCTNKSHVPGETLEKNLSVVPGAYIKHISNGQSENLTMVCPLNGAYKLRDVTWHHKLGTVNTIVRSFSSWNINLHHITYKDMGEYVCKVKYTSCGQNSKTTKRLTGKIYLSITGSPMLTNIKTHEDTTRKTLDFFLNVVSFPKPGSLIQIWKEDSFVLFERSVNFEFLNVPLFLVDKVVEVQGYRSTFTVTNITDDWYGRNTIVISNKLGSHAHAFTLAKKGHKSNEGGVSYGLRKGQKLP
ncbi:uncharacterized protein LOC134274875 [Saccostrea cucullata]|uniref:uncharacterized protein LOC134274875 n=1 Tax=Saccostrea cuccullata TaxID=36930 RepID=UPI002ED0A87E